VRILLATDGSEPSDVAVKVLSDRPWPKGSIVRVLCVSQNISPVIPEIALVDLEEVAKKLDRDAEKLVARVAETLRSNDLAVETKVRRGDPREQIVNDAKEWRADLIVLGSHGLTGFMHWFIGSVAEHVVRHAPCSVLIARSPSTKTPGKS